jgi:hypothetical protein
MCVSRSMCNGSSFQASVMDLVLATKAVLADEVLTKEGRYKIDKI